MLIVLDIETSDATSRLKKYVEERIKMGKLTRPKALNHTIIHN